MTSILVKVRSFALQQQVYLMPLTVVSVGHLLVDMYLGGFPVLFPILQETYALSYAQIGLLVFLVQFSSSVLQPIFGWLSDRWQVRSILQLSLALAAGGLALIVFAPNYMVVLFGTLICGLGVAAYHPEASKLALFAGGRRRAMAMSAFSLGGNLGLSLGPVIMTVGLAVAAMRGGTQLIGALIYVPITLALLLVIHRRRDNVYSVIPTVKPSSVGSDVVSKRAADAAGASNVRDGGVRSLTHRLSWRNWPLHHRWMVTLLLYIFLRSTAHTGMQTMIPLYYKGQLNTTDIFSSSVLTAFLVGGAVGTLIGGLLADSVGARRIAITSFMVSPVLIGTLPLVGAGTPAIALSFVAGLTLIASFSVTTVMGQQFMPTNVGLASGLTLGFSVGTGGAGAAVLGVIADSWGLVSAFFVMAALLVVGIAVALALPKEHTVAEYFTRNAER